MGSSNLVTSSLVTKEAALYFDNNIVVGKNIDMQYNSKIGNEANQTGDTLYIRKPAQTHVVDGSEGVDLSFADVNEGKVVLAATKKLSVPMQFTNEDLTMRIEEFGPRFIKPAVSKLATAVDAAIIKEISKNVATTLGSGLSALDSKTARIAKQYLAEFGAPEDGEFYGALTPKHSTDLSIAQLGLFNMQKAIERVYTKGLLGEFAGIMFAETANLYAHTAGTWTSAAVATSSFPLSGAGFAESFSLPISGATNGTIYRAGDVFQIAGCYAKNPLNGDSLGRLMDFVVTADVTITGTTGTIVIKPVPGDGLYNYATTPAAGAVLTIKGGAGSQESLVWHKSAIAGVSPKLFKPNGVDMYSNEKADSGFNIRFVRAYDVKADKVLARLDCVFGVAVVEPLWVSRIRGGM